MKSATVDKLLDLHASRLRAETLRRRLPLGPARWKALRLHCQITARIERLLAEAREERLRQP